MSAAGPGAVVVHSATAVDARGATEDAWVAGAGGRIQARGTGGGWRRHTQGAHVVDGRGAHLTPGFVDIHVHGGGGASHEDGAEAILRALGAHAAHGTTRTVVSLVSNPLPALAASLATVAELTKTIPRVLGSHLEGPFLSREHRGAHRAEHLRDPDPEAVAALLGAARGTLRQVTLDAGRPGALDATRALTGAGVRVALGHTGVGYDDARAFFEAGASILTHTFNAMPGLHHRAPGPVVAALDDERVSCELVLDGHHVHTRVAALLLAAAPHRVVLVTDAMAGAAAPAGRYRLGDVEVTVHEGRATLSGTTTLAGSVLTQDDALRRGLVAGVAAATVVEALTWAPAKAVGVADVGLLEPGHRDDLVVLDGQWHVRDVFCEGARLR